MPNGKHGHHGQPTTPFWKRLLVLAIKIAVVIAAAVVSLEHTEWVILVAAVGLAGYVVYRLVTETPVTDYLYSEVISLLGAIGVAVALREIGFQIGMVIMTGIVAYAALRVCTAWIGRVRYWYEHGTKGRMTWECQTCRSRRYRVGGDFVPHCYECGWRPGLPALRWIQYSVFAQQAWRTLRRARIRLFLISVLSMSIIVALTVGIGFGAPAGLPQGEISITGDTPDEDLDSEQIESLIVGKVNELREERNMEPLQYNDRVATAAQSHADDMAENNYFSHTSLTGETQMERYAFCNGGENIAQTWYNERIEAPDGATERYTTEEELAEAIVDQWMSSRPHREQGIYGDRWTAAGSGISVTDEGKVYAVLGFCFE